MKLITDADDKHYSAVFKTAYASVRRACSWSAIFTDMPKRIRDAFSAVFTGFQRCLSTTSTDDCFSAMLISVLVRTCWSKRSSRPLTIAYITTLCAVAVTLTVRLRLQSGYLQLDSTVTDENKLWLRCSLYDVLTVPCSEADGQAGSRPPARSACLVAVF